LKPRKRRPWKQNVVTQLGLLVDLIIYLRPTILLFLGDKKRWDKQIFRYLAYYERIKDRKAIEYALQLLLLDDVIKESREGDRRYFERIRKQPVSLL